MTGATMPARAERAILNSKSCRCERIDALDVLLERMSDQKHNKSPELRRLGSWPA